MKQFHIGITIVLSILVSSVAALGQNIYRWTDEQGRVHFSNAPVKEAQSVDDDLPPASNFGGAQDIFSSPEEAPSTTEQPSGASRPTAALPPNEGVAEENQDTAASDEANEPDSTLVTTEEESQTGETTNEEPGAEEQEIAPQQELGNEE